MNRKQDFRCLIHYSSFPLNACIWAVAYARRYDHDLKKLCIIVLAIISIVVFCKIYFYHISKYHEQNLQNGSAIVVRQYLDWELSVPIYFEIRKDLLQIFVSTPIYYASPELVDKKELNLEIHDYKELNIFIIVFKNEPNTIHGIGNYKENIYFPDYSRDHKLKDYHKKVYRYLTEIRKKTGKIDLKLSEFQENWEN